MNVLILIILGALQGLLEWLPVSSQGVITLILTLLGSNPSEAVNYAIFLHGGTAIAALVYYWKDFKKMITKGTLLGFVLLVTLLTLVIGAPLYLLLSNVDEYGGLLFVAGIGAALIITGAIQLKRKKAGTKQHPNRVDAFFTGVMQGFSVIPGISRSGMTISTLLLRKFHGETAIKLSFLLSVPAVLVAEIGLGLMHGGMYSIDGLWGLLSAFFVGLIGINLMIKIAHKINFGKLCILLGVIMAVSAVLRIFL